MDAVDRSVTDRISAKNELTNVPGDSVLEAAAEAGVENQMENRLQDEAAGGKFGSTNPDR